MEKHYLFIFITDSGFDTKGMSKEEMFEIVVSQCKSNVLTFNIV